MVDSGAPPDGPVTFGPSVVEPAAVHDAVRVRGRHVLRHFGDALLRTHGWWWFVPNRGRLTKAINKRPEVELRAERCTEKFHEGRREYCRNSKVGAERGCHCAQVHQVRGKLRSPLGFGGHDVNFEVSNGANTTLVSSDCFFCLFVCLLLSEQDSRVCLLVTCCVVDVRN
jgi:hypothetical protein